MRPIELKPKQLGLLRQMYPGLPWDYICVYQGMPWYMRRSFAIATALPSSYSGGYIHVYLREYSTDEEADFDLTCTLVHEFFHVQQYYDLGSMGRGGRYFGFFRPFLWHYFSWYFALLLAYRSPQKGQGPKAADLAYRFHPMEDPAYQFEAAFAEAYSDYRFHDLAYFFNKYPQLIRPHSGYPPSNRPPRWAWYAGIGLSALISLSKPPLDLCFGLPIWAWSRLRKPNNS